MGLTNSDGSLFETIEISSCIPSGGIGIVGQKGSWLRQRLIHEFSKRPDFHFVELSGWSVNNHEVTTEYVQSIVKNRTTLHLPGNITNQSFRYMECLLLNRLPTSPKYSFQDHHFTDYWTEHSRFSRTLSYKKLSSEILAMSDEEYLMQVKSARAKLYEWIKEIRSEVESFFCNPNENKSFEFLGLSLD